MDVELQSEESEGVQSVQDDLLVLLDQVVDADLIQVCVILQNHFLEELNLMGVILEGFMDDVEERDEFIPIERRLLRVKGLHQKVDDELRHGSAS